MTNDVAVGLERHEVERAVRRRSRIERRARRARQKFDAVVIAFIEELYEKFRSNPDSVSASWREFFHDYQPQLAEDLDFAPPSPTPAQERPRAAAPTRIFHPPRSCSAQMIRPSAAARGCE